jgi:hypothetical protein
VCCSPILSIWFSPDQRLSLWVLDRLIDSRQGITTSMQHVVPNDTVSLAYSRMFRLLLSNAHSPNVGNLRSECKQSRVLVSIQTRAQKDEAPARLKQERGRLSQAARLCRANMLSYAQPTNKLVTISITIPITNIITILTVTLITIFTTGTLKQTGLIWTRSIQTRPIQTRSI